MTKAVSALGFPFVVSHADYVFGVAEIPTGFRDDDVRGRCFPAVFVCLRGTADLSAAIVCYLPPAESRLSRASTALQAFRVEL